jgi:hypothetical protein
VRFLFFIGHHPDTRKEQGGRYKEGALTADLKWSIIGVAWASWLSWDMSGDLARYGEGLIRPRLGSGAGRERDIACQGDF